MREENGIDAIDAIDAIAHAIAPQTVPFTRYCTVCGAIAHETGPQTVQSLRCCTVCRVFMLWLRWRAFPCDLESPY